MSWKEKKEENKNMIQFKLFEAKYNPYISTEKQVNEWLKENPNIKVKDFKFQGNISGFADCGIHESDYYEALCLMYEIPDEEN